MKKLLPFIILIIVVIGILAAIPMLLQSDARRKQMVDYLSHLLHHKVVIGKMDSSFFPPSFELHEVGVFSDGVEAPVLQIDRAQIGVGLTTLFGGAFQPSSVTLDHPIIQFHRKPNGTWDMDDWGPALGALSGGSQSPVKAVSIQNGEAHWVDSFAPMPQELMLKAVDGKLDHEASTAKVTGVLSGAIAPVSMTFDGKGSFGSAAWGGELHLIDQSRQWTAHVQQATDRLTITGESTEWRWDQTVALAAFLGRLPVSVAPDAPATYLQNWKIEIDGSAAGVSVTHSAALGGGTTDAKFLLTEGAGGLKLQGAASLKNVTVQAACGPWGGCASVVGSLTAAVPHFMVSSSSGSTVATADGIVDVRDGRYSIPEESVQKLTHTHLLKYVKMKFPGVVEKGFAFTHVHGQASLSDGELTIHDAVLNASGLRAALAGRIEPSKKAVDAYVRLQINDSAPDRLQYIPGKYISGQAGHEHVQPIYGRLQGTWDEWLLRSLPSYKIPAAQQNQLKRSIAEQ